MIAEKLLEKGLVPDGLIRYRIRSLLRQRLKEIAGSSPEAFAQSLQGQPIAVATEAANEQHYEVPPAFFERVLGPRLKYSCALYEKPTDTLAIAEEQMLELTCQRAGLGDGQDVLELGCGWGSLTLWMAARFPGSRITGVSNSNPQREFIVARARSLGLKNVEILTRDMNQFTTELKYDRVVSVEMFEHMRNVGALLGRVATWLKPEGKLFVHVFAHREFAYLFEDRDESDWMSRFFFSGGMMPNHALYRHFEQDLRVEQDWVVSGTHYARTSEDWLINMDQHEEEIREIFRQTYGADHVSLWWARWRIFFMACAELWAWDQGQVWHVSHYLFGKTVNPRAFA